MPSVTAAKAYSGRERLISALADYLHACPPPTSGAASTSTFSSASHYQQSLLSQMTHEFNTNKARDSTKRAQDNDFAVYVTDLCVGKGAQVHRDEKDLTVVYGLS
ncbi:hypothetical protein K438DRAFT_1770098 [Mycena galopus ATCC 62051]|nr:hypothetical protein K438DRAFT_1770098 [Mycena galopus ATCC 62051]